MQERGLIAFGILLAVAILWAKAIVVTMITTARPDILSLRSLAFGATCRAIAASMAAALMLSRVLDLNLYDDFEVGFIGLGALIVLILPALHWLYLFFGEAFTRFEPPRED